MNILIIEDERPAAERLIAMVREFDPGIRITATLRSVKESVEWLSRHPAPDCILADIQLNDGLSLEIFQQLPVTSPLIFTTAYDEYLLKAFAFNSIDYLLKPIDKEKLFRALKKYQSLKQHFTIDLPSLTEQIRKQTPITDRMVVKKGTDFIALRMEQIAYFYSEHKITFLIDTKGVRYIVDKPLAEIERLVNGARFFRINRKYLAIINAISQFRQIEKGKVLVNLIPPVKDDVIVSQENAAAFKSWIGK
ncbi:MAG: LytTR family DNA-binding domain-containing protein [Bacteriovoracaceae bacterium]